MNSFVNLSTRAKLTIGFGLVIAIFAIVVATGFLTLSAVMQAQSNVADMLEVGSRLNGQRAALFTAMIVPPGPGQEAQFSRVVADSAENDLAVQRLRLDLAADVQLGAILTTFSALREQHTSTRDIEVIPLIRQGKMEEANRLAIGVQTERFDRLRSLSLEIVGELRARSEQRAEGARKALGVLSGCALLAAVCMVVWLTRLIAEPLAQLTAIADEIAHGNLNAEFTTVSRGDEVGALLLAFQRMTRSLKSFAGRASQIAAGDLTARIKPQSADDVLGNAFATMTETLRQLMSELLEAVNVLATSAAEIMTSTSQLAASAAQTAAAVTETTTTVEEVKQTSQVSSQKAKNVSDEAQKAVEVAREGKRSVDETIEGMGGIREQMDAVAESIVSLSAQSRAIEAIIATVDDFAAQSRLLAVNASIEAAKAGEEGKGFAIVAQEVKNLALQSKDATKQVRAILSDIQKATGTAVLATEQGSKSVAAGVRQSSISGESIAALAESISEAAQAASQIAATSQQQYVGMDQVALAMENIKTVSTQTVTSTRQAELAAQNLHELGQKLKALVGRFKV